jgi:hypothetical protein
MKDGLHFINRIRRSKKKSILIALMLLAFCSLVSVLANNGLIHEDGQITDDEFVVNKDDLTKVIVPDTLNFVIDPYGIDNRGQVYSDEYDFINTGYSDVLISILDIQVFLDNDDQFELASDSSLDLDEIYDRKAMYLELDFKDENIGSISVTKFNDTDIYSFALKSNQKLSFSLSGKVNTYPHNQWGTEDTVKIRMNYRMEAISDTGSLLSEDEPTTSSALMPLDPSDSQMTSDNPEATDEVDADMPSTSDEPTATDEPVTTDEPISTDKPATTDKPLATYMPIITDAPLITDKPLDVDEPIYIDSLTVPDTITTDSSVSLMT